MDQLTVKETIKQIQEKHIKNGGVIIGECITDPNAVGGTMPDPHPNMIDLPMTDVSGADFAVGCALVGRRPILLCDFKNFMLLNQSPFISYAATYKSIHGKAVPVLI